MGWVVEWQKVPYKWRSLNKVRSDAVVYSNFAFARGRSFWETEMSTGSGSNPMFRRGIGEVLLGQ